MFAHRQILFRSTGTSRSIDPLISIHLWDRFPRPSNLLACVASGVVTGLAVSMVIDWAGSQCLFDDGNFALLTNEGFPMPAGSHHVFFASPCRLCFAGFFVLNTVFFVSPCLLKGRQNIPSGLPHRLRGALQAMVAGMASRQATLKCLKRLPVPMDPSPPPPLWVGDGLACCDAAAGMGDASPLS